MAESRPNFLPNDEEGLLQMQEEFLAGRIPKSVIDVKSGPSSKPSHQKKSLFAQKRARNASYAETVKEKKQPHDFEFPQVNVLGSVVERCVNVHPPERPISSSKFEAPNLSTGLSFPQVFLRNKPLGNQSNQSLFATEIKKSKLIKEVKTEESAPENSATDESSAGDVESIKAEVHQENLLKLSAMVEEEIIQEQNSIATKLDPKLLSFLKNRQSKSTKRVQEKSSCSTTTTTTTVEEMDLDETTDELKKSNYINMNVVEKEKLQHWLSPLPSVKGRSDKYFQARFDFQGCLLPADLELPTTESALYHHGEEPERAGYSINELIILGNKYRLCLALNAIFHT